MTLKYSTESHIALIGGLMKIWGVTAVVGGCVMLSSCGNNLSCESDDIKNMFLNSFKSSMGPQLLQEYDIANAKIEMRNTRTVEEKGNGKICSSEVYITADNIDPQPNDTTNGEPLLSSGIRNYFIQFTDNGKLYLQRL